MIRSSKIQYIIIYFVTTMLRLLTAKINYPLDIKFCKNVKILQIFNFPSVTMGELFRLIPGVYILANCPYFGGTVPLFGAKFPTVPLLSLFFMPPKYHKFCIFDPKLCYFSPFYPIFQFVTENPTFLGILSLFLVMTGWQLWEVLGHSGHGLTNNIISDEWPIIEGA